MFNPLESEANAFRFLLYAGGTVVAITVLIVVLRALL
jgi:hypothetical protein